MPVEVTQHIPFWLQIALAIAALSQPFIVLMLTVAHQDRKELLAQVNKINGRIGVLESWRIDHVRYSDMKFSELSADLRRLQDSNNKFHGGSG